MFGPIGGPEMLLLLVLALLLFGPRKLPQIGKTLGKAMAEFRGATSEFRATLEREVELENVKEDGSELRSVGREIQDAVTGVAREPRSAKPDVGEVDGDPGRKRTDES